MLRCFTFRLPIFVLLCGLLVFAFPSAVLSQSTPVHAILATSDGRLVVGSDEGLHFHDAGTLERGKKIDSKIEKIYALRVSPDGKSVAVAGGTPAESGVIEIYSLPGLENIHRFDRFDDVVTDVAWTSDKQIVACSMTGKCCTIGLDEESSVHAITRPFTVHSKGALAVEFLKEGSIATCGLDSTIRVWAPNKPKDARILNNHLSVVNDIQVRPVAEKNATPTIVSASDDGTIRFWQPTIGRMLRFVRLDSIPTCVIWNHDGTRVVAGCRDGAIFVIDPTAAKVVRTIEGSSWIHCLARGINHDEVFVGSEEGISVAQLNPIER